MGSRTHLRTILGTAMPRDASADKSELLSEMRTRIEAAAADIERTEALVLEKRSESEQGVIEQAGALEIAHVE